MQINQPWFDLVCQIKERGHEWQNNIYCNTKLREIFKFSVYCPSKLKVQVIGITITLFHCLFYHVHY